MSRLWSFLAVALPVLAAVLAPLSSVDLAYQLRAGAEVLDLRSIPTVDTWTFTAAGVPWVDQQWGAQAVLAAAYRLAGWTGLVILRAGLSAVVIGATLVITQRRGLDSRSGAFLTIGAFIVAAPAMALRPQLFGLACFAITLLLVTGRRDHPRWLWLVPVVVTLWANLHGSFILGPIVLVLAWLEDLHDRVPAPHRALVAATVAVLAACLTPFGPGVWAYAAGLGTNPSVTARTSEWQPTSIRDVSGLLFFGSVAAVAALIARRGRSVPWPALLWLGAFAAIGVVAQRGVAWWPFVAVAVTAGWLVADRPRVESIGWTRLNRAVAAGLVLVIVALLPQWRPVEARTGVPVAVLTDAPPGITGALRAIVRPGDRILNPQRWGSWLEFVVPQASVAVDSRIEFFPPDVWNDYEGVFAGIDGWEERLAAWGVTVAITEPSDASLARRLHAAGWQARYEDTDGTVWVPEAVGTP